MKIAYIILSHRDWPQVAHLAQTLTSLDPSSTIVVSHDSADADGVRALEGIPELIVQSAPGGRGGFSGILRWYDAVQELRRRESVDYVILLSGQDCLIVNPQRIKRELQSSGDGFLEHFDVLSPEDSPWSLREARTRYYFSWRELSGLSARMASRLHILHGINRLQPWIRLNVTYGAFRLGLRHSGPPVPYVVYGGSQWNALSWRAVERVTKVLSEREDVVSWAQETLVSEECFFQTVVMNDPDLTVAQGSKRYYDFSKAYSGHPKTLQSEDFDAITSSDSWFARKVDWTSSRQLIKRIDEDVLKIPR